VRKHTNFSYKYPTTPLQSIYTHTFSKLTTTPLNTSLFKLTKVSANGKALADFYYLLDILEQKCGSPSATSRVETMYPSAPISQGSISTSNPSTSPSNAGPTSPQKPTAPFARTTCKNEETPPSTPPSTPTSQTRTYRRVQARMTFLPKCVKLTKRTEQADSRKEARKTLKPNETT
jgi:hypothetical protein